MGCSKAQSQIGKKKQEKGKRLHEGHKLHHHKEQLDRSSDKELERSKVQENDERVAAACNDTGSQVHNQTDAQLEKQSADGDNTIDTNAKSVEESKAETKS